MSKAAELAQIYAMGTNVDKKVARILRHKEAVIKQCLEALEWSTPSDDAVETYWQAIAAAKEVLE